MDFKIHKKWEKQKKSFQYYFSIDILYYKVILRSIQHLYNWNQSYVNCMHENWTNN